MSEFEYMLLGILRDDSEYYLRNGARHDTLWAGSPQRQIDKMLEIYDGLEDKPEWISREDILDYAERMGVEVVHVVYRFSKAGARALLYKSIDEWREAAEPVATGSACEGGGPRRTR